MLHAITVVCVEVTEGQGVLHTTQAWGLENIFANRHPCAMGIGLHAMDDFNFRDHEKSSKVKGHDAL